MFILKKNNLNYNSTNPTLLFGYEGFGLNVLPMYYKSWMPFLNDGGILAVANIRGGGEFGEKWHNCAIKENKQKSFDDFNSCARFLIENKYTNNQKLISMGASNGGLLVLTCMAQSPDLFKEVISRVPLTDMIRFHKFFIASRWTGEYGNPEIENEFNNILKWSPYHNLKMNTEYPSIFMTTALNDMRVSSMHAFKMTALLQRINKINPILLI